MRTLTKLSGPAALKAFFMSVAVFCSVLFNSISVWAQSVPDKVEVDINSDGGTAWYGQPWVWAIGVAVFVIIIVAITRSNKNA